MMMSLVLRRTWLGAFVCVACVVLGPVAAAATDEDEHMDGVREALERLELATASLEELERGEAAAAVNRIADRLRGELERGERGHRRERIEAELEALRLALPALREAERPDAADMVERAIGLREIMLEGGDDRALRRARAHAPGNDDIRELLVLAQHAYGEFHMGDQAERLARLTRELWGRGRGRERDHGPRDHPTEREVGAHQVQVMRLALPALREAGRKDAAELLERAIRAREVALEGRRDEEARDLRAHAPNLAQQVEILTYASKLWEKFGDQERSAAVGELAERMRGHLRRGPEREREEVEEREEARRDRGRRRLEELEERLTDLRRAMESLQEQLQDLRER